MFVRQLFLIAALGLASLTLGPPVWSQDPPDPAYSIDFQNAQMTDVAQWVSGVTGSTYTFSDPEIAEETITLITFAENREHLEELYTEALAEQGIVVVIEGELWIYEYAP